MAIKQLRKRQPTFQQAVRSGIGGKVNWAEAQKAFALAEQYALTTKAADPGDLTNIFMHGLGGLFQTAADRVAYSAVVGKREGFESTLGVRPNRQTNPSVYIITGTTAVDDTTAGTGDCADFPLAPLFKRCLISNYPFGKYGLESRTLDILRTGELADRGDFDNYMLKGTPFGPGAEDINIPSTLNTGAYSQLMNNDGAKQLQQVAIGLQQFYGRQAIFGNPANNTPGSPIQEMRGLDLLINDTYSDETTGSDCDRVDSRVTNFETVVGASPAPIETFSNDIVRSIIETIANLQRRSQLMGLGNRWNGYILMHYNLFRQLVFLWASTYYSYRTTVNTSNEARLDGFTLVNEMRDMLTNYYLIGDMGNIPVVTDPAIIETINGSQRTSTIYFVPMEAAGETVTYMEYFPFNTEFTAQGILNMFGINANAYYEITDNGRFITHFKPPVNYCIQITTAFRTRVRLDTPFLAARIDNVTYTPDPFPVDETYDPTDPSYLNGGVTGPLLGATGTVATITACADNAPGDLTFTLQDILNCENGTDVVVIDSNGVSVPAVISAGNNTTSVTIDFTTARTPVVLQALTCADLSFVGGTVNCDDFTAP